MEELLKKLLRPFWGVMRNAFPAKWHVIIDHLRCHGKFPDLEHPKSFNEKIAYRMLYDRDPRIPPLVDKITAKELMAARFGSGFIIPTQAIYESESEVDFGALSYPCVIKANHGSGLNLFLKTRPAEEKKVRQEMHRFLRHNHYAAAEEWAYSQIHPRLLVEPFIEGGEHGLVDYKFHTFAGKVYAIQVDVDRYTGHRRNFYDCAWTRMPVELLYPKADREIAPPSQLQKMIRYAEQIGGDFSYLRVDLYESEGQVKFGEATFYHGAGYERFTPPEYDELFGAQWQLKLQ